MARRRVTLDEDTEAPFSKGAGKTPAVSQNGQWDWGYVLRMRNKYDTEDIEILRVTGDETILIGGQQVSSGMGGVVTATATLNAEELYSLSETNGAVIVTPPPDKRIVVLGVFYKFTVGPTPFTVDPTGYLALSVEGAENILFHIVDIQQAEFLGGSIDQRLAMGSGGDLADYPVSSIGKPLRLFYGDYAETLRISNRIQKPSGSPRIPAPITGGDGTLEVVIQYVLDEPGDAGNGVQVAQVTLDAATIRGLTPTNGALLIPGVPGATIIPLGFLYSYEAGTVPFTISDGYDWTAVYYEGIVASGADLNRHYIDYAYHTTLFPADGDKDTFAGNGYDGTDDGVHPQFEGKGLRIYAGTALPLTGGDGSFLTVTVPYILDTAVPSGNVILVRKTIDAATIRSLSDTNGALFYQPPLNTSAFVLGGFIRRKGSVAFVTHAKGTLNLGVEGLDPYRWSHSYGPAGGLPNSAVDTDCAHALGFTVKLAAPYTTRGKPLRLFYSTSDAAAAPNPLPPITGGDGTLELVFVIALTPDLPSSAGALSHLSSYATSPAGLAKGSVWVDAAAGHVLKVVP